MTKHQHFKFIKVAMHVKCSFLYYDTILTMPSRGPFDDVFIQNMKALGLVVSDKKIVESVILKPIY